MITFIFNVKNTREAPRALTPTGFIPMESVPMGMAGNGYASRAWKEKLGVVGASLCAGFFYEIDNLL